MDRSNPKASPDKSLSDGSPAYKQSPASNRRNEPSPRHLGRVGGKGSGMRSPSSRERNGGGKLSPRPVTRRNDMDYDDAIVPKFGDWDENDPASADGLTHKFGRVTEAKLKDKENGPVLLMTPSRNSKTQKVDKTSENCFRWKWRRYICLG